MNVAGYRAPESSVTGRPRVNRKARRRALVRRFCVIPSHPDASNLVHEGGPPPLSGAGCIKPGLRRIPDRSVQRKPAQWLTRGPAGGEYPMRQNPSARVAAIIVLVGVALLLVVAGPATRSDTAVSGETGASISAGMHADWWQAVHEELTRQGYRASETGAGYQVPNRAHDLRAWFRGEGVEVVPVVPVDGPVRVEVFDLLGRRVMVLAEEHQTAGSHAVTWDGRDRDGTRLPAGAYFARLEHGGMESVTRLVLVR